MRPQPWCTVLHVSLWAALVLTLNADSEDSDCSPVIKVRRHTTYKTSPGRELVIHCPVDFCNKSIPTVTWVKLLYGTSKRVGSSSHIRTEWRGVNHEWASLLIFPKILSSDSGLYQCRMGSHVGHAINVSVHVPETSDPETLELLWMYMSSAARIVGFVTVSIVITVVSILWCKGKSKKGPQGECQDTTIEMVEGTFTRGGPPARPCTGPGSSADAHDGGKRKGEGGGVRLKTLSHNDEDVKLGGAYLEADSRLHQSSSMRPQPWCTVLHVSLWAALVLTLNADSEDSGCNPSIKVRRNTTYETSSGRELVIHCPVDFCNKSEPTVTWFKLLNGNSKQISVGSSSHIRSEWKEVNHEWASLLIFPKILSNDSGVYQCRVGNDVSHVIRVSVHGGDGHSTTKNKTIPETSDSEALKPLWMYMSSAAGIVGFVTLVIVLTVVSMRCCTGKSKKGTQGECQYATIHLAERPLTCGGPPPGQRASPSAPPSRLSAPKDIYSKVKGEGKRTRGAAEECSGVVYAALNHQQPPGAAARPRRSEECSEYAAIRVA
ncbi:uncharacterized protein LOC132996987 [Limanda limanda]|uniref:uncharacterized protein LOC132996987 n=1 Tax=Limanda limanda TaxID=27771 RepID=UPI0029C6C2C4|nr:uncharacterized protein LOC132996987 [Limanda limanda]